jgi:signal transduction histidine kinase
MLVMGDEKRLHQVLTNLIANAIKFTPSGGDISASLDISGRDLQISIRDDGPGIEPELATRLFQRYQRADANVAGSGLGLMIVREIVEAHGGTVGVESSPGAGARFWLRLPRSGEPVHAA